MECRDCKTDHINQKTDYPLGIKVRASTYISCAGECGEIAPGTMGRVTGHCDDGRAVVYFEGHGVSHTFHHPETAISIPSLPYAAGMATDPIAYAIKTLEWVSDLVGQEKRVEFALMALKEFQAEQK